MKIQVVQDLICPWCRIGHHNLEQALATWSNGTGTPVTIEWLPYHRIGRIRVQTPDTWWHTSHRKPALYRELG